MKDGKYVVLYVDDDQDMLNSVRTVLEANNYGMVEALSAEAGVQVYKDEQPDFVIVDLMMEEIDAGTNFAKQLKELGNTKPLYMLSSMGDQLNLNADHKAMGLDGIFQKPINFDSLLNTLKTKLG